MLSFWLITAAALVLAGCHDSRNSNDNFSQGSVTQGDDPPVSMDELIEQGKQIFRFETFGDEVFWTDVLKMNEVMKAPSVRT